jgi:acetyl esterase
MHDSPQVCSLPTTRANDAPFGAAGLHPQYRAIQQLMTMQQLSPGDPLHMPLPVARRRSERFYAFWNHQKPRLEAVYDTGVARLDGPVALRIYRPRLESAAPVLIYFHGGGFALNSINTHDRLMRLLALQGNVTVCAVAYSLAPEKRYPCQVREALAVVEWLHDKPAGLGHKIEALALGGDSAGANLALATALALKDSGRSWISRLLLFYGMFAPEFSTLSHERYGTGYGLTTERMRWFWSHYLQNDGQRNDPYAAPMYADLRGLPPVLLIAAGCDCLRDDSMRIADRLHTAGVPHQLSCYGGVLHSFMQFSQCLDPARQAIEEAASVLRALGPDGTSDHEKECAV